MGADYKNFSSCSPLENHGIGTEKEGYIEAISYLLNKSEDNLLCQPEDDNMKEIMKQVINQVEYKELSSNDQLENHVLFTEEGADVEAIGILSSDEQEKQVINQVEYKKVSSNDQLENYILFTEKEGYIEAISYLLSKSEDNSSSESMVAINQV